MTSVGAAVDALVVGSVLVGVPLTWRTGPRQARAARGPGFWLGAVAAAIYLNQLLFTVYVLRVHRGDPSFIARYLPPGWFDLAHGGAMRAVATAFPAPELLEVSVLRVQAVLELPFVILAYLCVCRWLDPVRARVLSSPAVLWAACVAYCVVFGLVEWGLRNPYTTDDLILRAVSCVATAALAGRSAKDLRATKPESAVDVLLAVGSAAALGVLVLVVYDTALLYNLGHVPRLLPVAAVAAAALAAARLLARRRAATPREAGAGVRTVSAGLAWFAALFFVPALPIRYALDLGTPWLAVAGAAVVAVTAAALTVREVTAGLGRTRRAVGLWLAQVSAATVAGLAAASAALLPPPTYPEVRILLAAALFLVTVTAACAVTDTFLRREPA
ncbi:hypothetical protein OHA72_25455 [Dactylosporangium sp. NBC_01737]|uniref:hypothetical protein n=1 Tax=Dactylosporangium sp. NBC_01737 TaxID=2975959 RepID=UPI002E11DD17|nr:hypothetical protein OHA72_25455 [Dactylosporangium sp. NBC_01737]